MSERLSPAGLALVILFAVGDAGAQPSDGAHQGPLEATPTPGALTTAMEKNFAALTDYEGTIRAQLVKGKETTKLRGRFYFKKPRQILLTIPRRGGVLFRKDGRIRGWFLTRLLAHDHGPGDEVLRDVRGNRLDHYVLGDIIQELKSLLGRGARSWLTPAPGPGKPAILLEVAPPGDWPFSRRVYRIDPEILLPLGYETFEQSAKVEEVLFENLRVNPGLKDELFE